VSRLGLLVALAVLAGPAHAGALPDLALDVATLGRHPVFDLKSVSPDDCTLQPADLCVGGPGVRKLLRFDVLAVNVGAADLVLGVPDTAATLPDGEPMWVYSACHGHFHFQTFARYELRRRGETTPVLEGAKRSFCVEDTQRVTGSSSRRYCCTAACGNVQGVQVGWGDLYASNLDCQWIDLTDGVEPGEYDLCVLLNTARLLPDADPSNDVGCVPVTVSGPPPDAPAPRVRLTAPRKGRKPRAGHALRIAWKKRVRGAFRFQEVWASRDGGATWQLLAADVPEKRHTYRWMVPSDAATDAARVRVVVWARNPPDDPGAGALQRGIGESATFRIRP
jgi:lysyl oxidase